MPEAFYTRLPPAKVLLVDDREENLLALSALLKPEGYFLVEAHSGQEAIEMSALHDFAAILMDVQMPALDGFQTAQILRQRESSKKTPIIFVTAIHRTEAHAHKGYFLGAIDYLYKPIDTDILKAKLSIITELYQKNQEIIFQNQRLQDQALRELQAAGLREALAARDEFLSLASHELKTPITPLNLQMQAFLRMVRNKTLKNMDDELLERMLLTAYGQVERLSETIDKLLDVSRFTTGKAEINLQATNLTDLVKKVVASYSPQLVEVGCRCTLEAPADLEVVCDRFRFEQVVINLLVNAMKYGAGKPIEIALTASDTCSEMRIKDFGIGIAKEDHSRIFNRFERAASSQNYGGMGLGLYIACEILRHHHGSIEVQSDLGQGAMFTVKLPHAQPAEIAL